MNFENYTYLLSNLKPKEFSKQVIEKGEYENIRVLGIEDIEQVINIMLVEKYEYCYDIQCDIMYSIEDLKECEIW